MVDAIPFDKLQRSFSGRFCYFLDAVKKSFVGVDKYILQLILNVFPVYTFRPFLPAIATEIECYFALTIFTYFAHGYSFWSLSKNNVYAKGIKPNFNFLKR